MASGIQRNPMPDPKIAAMAWYEQLRGFVEKFLLVPGEATWGEFRRCPSLLFKAKNSQDQRRVLLLSRGWVGRK
ncbi:MAG: hypothetical protein WA709_26970 [Stellaceae bacterium]